LGTSSIGEWGDRWRAKRKSQGTTEVKTSDFSKAILSRGVIKGGVRAHRRKRGKKGEIEEAVGHS